MRSRQSPPQTAMAGGFHLKENLDGNQPPRRRTLSTPFPLDPSAFPNFGSWGETLAPSLSSSMASSRGPSRALIMALSSIPGKRRTSWIVLLSSRIPFVYSSSSLSSSQRLDQERYRQYSHPFGFPLQNSSPGPRRQVAIHNEDIIHG